MHSRLFRWSVVSVSVIFIASTCLSAAPRPDAASRSGSLEDQAQAGKWVGTYTTGGGETGKVSFTLSQDDQGQWKASVTYTNQNGDQTSEIKELRVSESKFSGRFESPDGMEITLEGVFQEGQFSGTYTVREKGSTEVAEKGTWKTAKS